MKDLDIEKLERKNIYKVPDNFFEEMQMKVLLKTAPKKEAKIIKLNWAYSAAAAVAMIFGITFFVTQKDNGTEGITTTNQTARNENGSAINLVPNDQPKKEAVIAYQTLEKDLTNAVGTNQTESKATTAKVLTRQIEAVEKNTVPAVQNPEVQVDQILASFSASDLADLGKNTEQDVYLDLYN